MPPCGGHLQHHPLIVIAQAVSSRAPVWGASLSNRRDPFRPGFQVVPPCGGHRPPGCGRLKRWHSFKSCPRVGGIPLPSGYIRRGGLFQVVPPCGGHQPAQVNIDNNISVSSRAPVWGASADSFGLTPIGRVSSRAPVWGASCEVRCDCNWGRFQVVPPCGGHPFQSGDFSVGMGFKSCPRVGGIPDWRPRQAGRN